MKNEHFPKVVCKTTMENYKTHLPNRYATYNYKNIGNETPNQCLTKYSENFTSKPKNFFGLDSSISVNRTKRAR